MHKLKLYLMEQDEAHGRSFAYQRRLAAFMGRGPTYLSRQLAGGRPFSEQDAIAIEQFTNGEVKAKDILPNVDWDCRCRRTLRKLSEQDAKRKTRILSKKAAQVLPKKTARILDTRDSA